MDKRTLPLSEAAEVVEGAVVQELRHRANLHQHSTRGIGVINTPCAYTLHLLTFYCREANYIVKPGATCLAHERTLLGISWWVLFDKE